MIMLSTKHNQPFAPPQKKQQSSEPDGQTEYTRRDVLLRTATLIALGAGAATLPGSNANAAKKSPQSLVKYRPSPKGKRKCSGCTFFLPDQNACKVVQGSIDPNGWCLRWSKKRY